MRQPKPLALVAASGLAIGTTLIGCTPGGGAQPVKSAASIVSLLDKGAAEASDAAARALAEGDVTGAVAEAEKAVGLSPRDAGYRNLLGNIYLKAGRFDSAEQAFTEVLLLNPGDGRAALSRALAQVALGDFIGARTTLANAQGPIAAADLGLATALAGDPSGALSILNEAARSQDADGRVRQNLALVHALAGQWGQARVVAAQDVAPDELPARLAAWADLARPDRAADLVPTLLGVQRAEDPGRPQRLALIVEPAVTAEVAAPAPEQTVAAEVTPDIVQPEVAGIQAVAPVPPKPVFETPTAVAQVTAVEPSVPATEAPAEAPAAAPAPNAWEALAEVRKAASTRGLKQAPTAELVRAALAPRPASRALDAPRSLRGRFVVQFGAFASLTGVERAWAGAVRRYGRLGTFQPSSTGVTARGATLHRLSVGGFATQRAAQGLCVQYRRHGGSCFVRVQAGDQPIRWASRRAGKA